MITQSWSKFHPMMIKSWLTKQPLMYVELEAKNWAFYGKGCRINSHFWGRTTSTIPITSSKLPSTMKWGLKGKKNRRPELLLMQMLQLQLCKNLQIRGFLIWKDFSGNKWNWKWRNFETEFGNVTNSHILRESKVIYSNFHVIQKVCHIDFIDGRFLFVKIVHMVFEIRRKSKIYVTNIACIVQCA